jgi:hypothetical protein
MVAALGALLVATSLSTAALAPFAPTHFISRAVPKHLKRPPFTFTNKGNLQLPVLICPKGVTNPAYCSKPPLGSCSGVVKIVVALRANPYLDPKGGKIVKQLSTNIKPNCHWSVTVTFPASEFSTKAKLNYLHKNAYIGIDFKTLFMGNSFVTPALGKTQTVIAEIQQLS